MSHRLPLLLTCALLWPAAAVADDWPQFRGPTGQGVTTAANLPLEWAPDRNVVWKKPIPGSGWSSPVVVRGRIYLTTSIPQPDRSQSLAALALDAAGSILWQQEVFRQPADAPRIHTKNSHASPTPVVHDGRLYVHFGHQGTACLDLDGKVLWRNNELNYQPVHGNGGTPIVAGDKLVFSCDGGADPFVVALARDSGRVVWKQERTSDAAKKFSFSTPLLIAVNGRQQVVSAGSNVVNAYDPETGREIWHVRYQGYSIIPRPVYGHGLVFLSTSYDAPTLLAIRPDGQGDVTDTHLVWKVRKGAPNTPSPLLHGDELYLVSDGGLASCLDAKTGQVHWQERIGGAYSASPLLAGDRIYFQSEDGVTTVVRAGKQFEVLGKSRLDERTLASYAVADGAIFLRTAGHLYRLEAR